MLGQAGPQCPRFQIQLVIEHDGKRCETDVPLTASDIARLGVEAAVQNRTMTQLLTQAVRVAIKKDLFQQILLKLAPTGAPPNANGRA